MLRLGFARILDAMRNLQILLEQSKLWKGELARHPLFLFRVFLGRGIDVLGEFYG